MDNRPGDAPPTESAERVRSAIGEGVDSIKQSAGDAAASIKQTIKEQAGNVKHQAMDAADGMQEQAASQTRTAAATLRDTAQGLNGELPWMKTALLKTAEGFDQLTDALKRGNLGSAVEGVSGFARRQPALFLGLSVAAGFALARVGKTAMAEMAGDRAETGASGDIGNQGAIADKELPSNAVKPGAM